MPEEPWVVDLARKHALQHVLEEQRERKRLTGYSGDTCANKEFSRISQSLCLVSVSPGKLGHGILTDWTEEEEYLRKGLLEALEKSSSPCDELKLEAETLSALKCRVARAIERNEGKDFQAALSANPKKITQRQQHRKPQRQQAYTVMASPSPHGPQEELSPTSPAPAETALPPDSQNSLEEIPPKRQPAAFIRVFADGSFDVVTAENPDLPVPLQPGEEANASA